jgi:hypothetical protein
MSDNGYKHIEEHFSPEIVNKQVAQVLGELGHGAVMFEQRAARQELRSW